MGAGACRVWPGGRACVTAAMPRAAGGARQQRWRPASASSRSVIGTRDRRRMRCSGSRSLPPMRRPAGGRGTRMPEHVSWGASACRVCAARCCRPACADGASRCWCRPTSWSGPRPRPPPAPGDRGLPRPVPPAAQPAGCRTAQPHDPPGAFVRQSARAGPCAPAAAHKPAAGSGAAPVRVCRRPPPPTLALCRALQPAAPAARRQPRLRRQMRITCRALAAQVCAARSPRDPADILDDRRPATGAD